MSKGFASIIAIFLLVIFIIAGVFIFNRSSEEPKVFYEKIKGSKFHSPDATWWGYNQSKIVRYKNIVFTYYIDNDDDKNTTSSKFVVMKKDGEGAWEEGTAFPTSRPGNLLIDSKGVLHAFIFEPFDVVKNDSIGRILHYYFPNSASGDIKNYKQEIVVDNDGKSETANIRVGAAIGADDTMAISFGLTKFNPAYKEQSEHIYYKKPNEEKWNHTFTDGLIHDYYYPFTLVSGNSFMLLPVQDDYNGPGTASVPYPNIYQKILFMEVKDGIWKNEMIADLSSHPLAKTRPRLLEQEDLFKDRDGNIHIIYKEFLDETNQYAATIHWHVSGKGGNWNKEQINLEKPGVNWIRFVEVDGNLYYLITTFGEVFISPIKNISKAWPSGLKLTKIDIPEDAKNNYPYISTPKGGSTKSDYVDVLLLGADQKLFQKGEITNYYVRIPKKQFINEEIKEVSTTMFVAKYVIDGKINTPSGKVIKIRTIWIIEQDQKEPRFVTV